MNLAGKQSVMLDRAMVTEGVLQGLAQDLQYVARKLWELVEKEHAIVGQTDLARSRRAAASAEQPSIRNRMVRRPERPLSGRLIPTGFPVLTRGGVN
jgi:hypothetical protein